MTKKSKFVDQAENQTENQIEDQSPGQDAEEDDYKAVKPPKELSEVGAKISAAQSGVPKPTITITCNDVEYTNLTQALYANGLVNQEAYKADAEAKKAGDKLWSQIRNALKRAGETTYEVPNVDESLPPITYVFKAVNQDWVAPQPTEEELAEKERIKQEKAEAKAAKAAAKAAAASTDEEQAESEEEAA